MNNFIIDQAYISKENPPNSRIYDCIQIPDHFPLQNVQLPSTMMNQTKPLSGSLVLVATIDKHRHYILAVLREPSQTLNQDTNQVLGSNNFFTGTTLAPGEVFLQAAGTPNVTTGLGASLYIGNTGSLKLSSSSATEQIIVGGTDSDEMDHEIIVRAPNVFIESTLTSVGGIQSSLNFDDLNYISLSNNIVTPATSLSVPISELTMSPLGDITLRNTNAGVTKGYLIIDSLSDVFLGNTTSSLLFDPVGNVSLEGTTINLNAGILGVARRTDSTFSSIVQDPQFWLFIENLFFAFNAHVHTSASPGNPTTPPLTPLVSYPSQMAGIISSSSITVLAGD